MLGYNIITKIAQYNSANIKLSISQLNEWKLATKNGTEVTLKQPPNMIDGCNDEVNVPHKFISSW